MRLKFFAIPALGPEAAEAELHRFLASHRVSQVERHCIADGAASYWAVCVTWVEGDPAAPVADATRRSRIDYREVLAADEFALYDRLRTLRKQFADAESVPPFAVFTNDHLAEMVRQRVATAAGLAAIPGVGEARLARYGPAFVELLAQGVGRLGPPSAPGGK